MQGQYLHSVYWVLAGGAFDVLDGAAARMLKVSSPIGKDLDSLADVVTFGVVPALWATSLMAGLDHTMLLAPGFHWVGFLIAPASALRLAKFNHDNRQTLGFVGMPTPANTLLWAGILVWGLQPTPFLWQIGPEFVRLGWQFLVLVSAAMLHAEVPMLSLKFRPGGIMANRWPALLILLGLVLFAWLGLTALAPIIGGYVFLSLLALPQKAKA